MKETVVIIGAGQAGCQTALSLSRHAERFHIVLIGAEPDAPYERPPLSKAYLKGDLPAQRLLLRPAQVYADKGIALRTACPVTGIDRAAQQVHTATGALAYDHLVLATGARVRRLPALDGPGTHYLRSRADADALKAALRPGVRLAVVGGGYIGLEAAASARALGAEVTVVEAADRVMARTASAPIAEALAARHRAEGVRLITGTAVMTVQRQDDRLTGLDLATGEPLAADRLLVGIGVDPEVALAEAAGLSVDRGILVDAQGRTDDPRIYACGDCAAYAHPLAPGVVVLESVQNAVDQAKAVAAAIAGAPMPYDAVPWFWSDQYDVKLQSVGLFQPTDQPVVRRDGDGGLSVAHLRDGRLVAVETLNRTKDFVQAKALIARGARPDPARLADPSQPLKMLA